MTHSTILRDAQRAIDAASMSIPEFLRRLAATPRGWRLEADGSIRLHAIMPIVSGSTVVENRLCCPITAAHPSGLLDEGFVRTVGFGLGLSEATMTAIIRAADNRGSSRLRRQLLRACGLPVTRGRGKQ